MRLEETRASQQIRTKIIHFSPVPVYPLIFLFPEEKKTNHIHPRSCLILDVKHNPNCTPRIKVCWLPACWNKPSTRKEIKIWNFSALPYRGEMLLQKLWALICLYLVLYVKLLLPITVSQVFGLLKLSKSHNSFLHREHMTCCLFLLRVPSLLIPLHPSLQFHASSTSNNLILYILIFKGTYLCPLDYLCLQYDIISL